MASNHTVIQYPYSARVWCNYNSDRGGTYALSTVHFYLAVIFLCDKFKKEHSEYIKSSEGDCTEHTNHSIEERMQKTKGPIRFCHSKENTKEVNLDL